MTSAIVYILQAVSNLFLLILLLRFWMPWFSADFRNPIAQAVLRLTSPLVVPLRRILPPVGRVDTATVIVAFGVQYLAIFLILLVLGGMGTMLLISLTALLDLAILSAGLFMVIILLHILLGWFAQGAYNPATALVHSMAEPLLRPFRRIVPQLGGLDISPVIPMILLGAMLRALQQYRPFPF